MSTRGRLRLLARALVSGPEHGSLSLALGPGWAAQRWALLAGALLVAANVAAFVLLTLPAWRASAAVQDVTRASEQAEATVAPALARARRAYGGLLQAQQQLEQLRAAVRQRSGSVSELVSTLRAAVDASGAETDRVSYQVQPISELGLTQIQVEMPVRGSYRQLRRLLVELLDGPGFVVIERVSASTPTVNETDQSLRLQLGLSAFVTTQRPSAAPAPAGEASVSSDAAEPVSPSTPGSEQPAGSVADPVAAARALNQRLAELPAVPVQAEDLELDLSPLSAERPPGGKMRRNLFAFVARHQELSIEQQLSSEPEPYVPPEPVMPYELVGITRTAQGLLATLSDGDHVLLLGKGEMLPEGYRVRAIDLVSVQLEVGDAVVRLSLRNQEKPRIRSLLPGGAVRGMAAGAQRVRAGPEAATSTDKPHNRKKKKKGQRS